MKNEQPLSTKEHIENIIYYMFRYSLYAIAIFSLINYIGKIKTLLLLIVFIIFSYIYRENKEKIIEKCYVDKQIYIDLLNKYSKNSKVTIKSNNKSKEE